MLRASESTWGTVQVSTFRLARFDPAPDHTSCVTSAYALGGTLLADRLERTAFSELIFPLAIPARHSLPRR